MVSDSPYDIGLPILAPRDGVAVGLAGTMGLLVALYLLQPLSGLSASGLLAQTGRAVLPRAELGPEGSSLLVAGVVLHALLGALFGLLYAVCQDRVPLRGLIGVGVFYGLVLWVLVSLLVGGLLGEAVRAMLRTWPYLLAWLVYGLCLAAATGWVAGRGRGRGTLVVPRD